MRTRIAGALALLVAVAAAPACSVQEMQEARAERAFARHGLQEHTVVLDEATLHYWKGGEGPPLLMLHGFGADALFSWAEQASLADDHTVIAPDLVWFGESTSERRPSLSAQADAMLALLDHEGVATADVMGISYGGLVTWQAVARQPERFGRVVLVDSPVLVYTEADRRAMLDAFGVDSVAGVVIPEEPGDIRRLIDLAYHDPPWVPGFVLPDLYRHMFSQQVDEKRALLAELAGRGDEERPGWPTEAPTLVVWGEHDPLFPLPIGRRLAAALDAPLVVIDDADHAPNIEHPEEFTGAVRAFLAGEAVPGAVEVAGSEPAPARQGAREATAAAAASDAAGSAGAGPGGFRASVEALPADLRGAMTGVSWRQGCPVGLDDLRLVTVTHHGFDGAVHTGHLVVAAEASEVVVAGFRAAFDEGFAIERMRPVYHYGGDDAASMAANNTSAFNCRPVTGGSGWSRHSYGTAIDVNPVQNPYVRGDTVLPPAGAAHLDRDPATPGLLTAESALVRALEERGWGWGGRWESPRDYQHLSASGR